MHKATSQFQQFATRRGATESRKNSGGLDPSVFDQERQRDRLAIRLKELDILITRLRETIGAAGRKLHVTGKRAEPAIYNKWKGDLQRAREEKLDIERQLSRLRSKHRERMINLDESFDGTFKQMAKQLLASDVYDRILAATIHRMGERDEEQRR